ncbi:MAG: zinc-binding dehydrogenase [Gammaproteobacteria bacterium]|jgi:NADPH:quinone reductase-like Zn-dependent oxidoreductase|nr:zinc-binding dehydrogenase [Gammaproteobacteria bacterium]MBT3858463.1 zinc-binding dehydrogenase [Gammaproteobacteria bacterium]MBT3986799.1 zinc-binding dehydrogenase [Gammaproteobacteria bacterium]MBT4255965.1 zinc-binding dehydrogenase [Gammaproteobacteria bacterium]MBT4582022.1 zinc-binding dehydrogenase [Gammaproteobacteria bacterium]
MSLNSTYLQMFSTVSDTGELRLELIEQETPKPEANQVLVRVEATPINPSDQGVMFGWADIANAKSSGEGKGTVLSAPVSEQGLGVMKARMGQSLPVGNEGAGTVVATGDSEMAKSLDGKIVAVMGGGMYGEYRCVDASSCLPLLDGHTAKDGASCFVNPLTALSMIETMNMEGHSALIHTAAASNLGQMLVRICQQDGVELVNIVRKDEQADLLRSMGAKYVVNSSSDNFMSELTDAIEATGATLAFDATGGGTLASTILSCMEAAAARTPGAYSIYGSIKHKQVYLYGGLDTSATTLNRGYGMAWGVGGWLLPNFLAKAGLEVAARLRSRVANELKTNFASHYTNEISLSEALQVETVQSYYAKHTGEKFLICPQK